MYETCKKQYERKIEKGTMIKDYADKQVVYIGIFLMNELLTEEEYQELLEMVTVE